MAVNKENIQSKNDYVKSLVELGINEADAKKVYEYNKSYINGTYVAESCIVCGANHNYYVHRANKQLLRNLDVLVEAGGKMPTKNQKVKNNQEHNDINKKSLLVHFGLAYYEDMYNKDHEYIGTFYSITEAGQAFADGTGKIPFAITIRDGEVVDRYTKCLVTRNDIEEEYLVGAKFRKTSKQTMVKYVELNLRSFMDDKHNKFIFDEEL